MIRKTTILAMIVTVAVIGLLTSTVSFSNAANDSSTASVPSWIQNVAGFWSNGDVSDGEFVNAMTFLVEEGIMDLPNVVSPAEAQTITSSLEDMNERLEKIEEQTITEEAPQAEQPKEPPEDLAGSVSNSICPANKVQHWRGFEIVFDATVFKNLAPVFNDSDRHLLSVQVDPDDPKSSQTIVVERMDELGYTLSGGIQITSGQIGYIGPTTYAIICAE